MSQLPDKAIQEFREIWKKNFGEEISEEYAHARAHEVSSLLRLVLEKPRQAKLETSALVTPDALTQLKRMRFQVSVNNDSEPK